MCFRRTLFALLAGAVLSLAGCAAPAPENNIRTLQGGDGGSLPRQLAGQTLALDRFRGPPELAGLESNGEISSDRSGWRQWLFGDPGTRL
ncbi:MAG: hypothetical protein U9Q93_14630, partial [Pseudomonadota bacterium]|nr:hypothetical protein [Pseudomonadota bacterium]